MPPCSQPDGMPFLSACSCVQAPGYSQLIKRPMSFSQMQTRQLKGEYPTWDVVQSDLETMFNNAMVFNAPTTPYHQKVIQSWWHNRAEERAWVWDQLALILSTLAHGSALM